MDKLNHYRQIIQDIVAKHAQHKPSHGEIEPIQIGGLEHDNYSLIGCKSGCRKGSSGSVTSHFSPKSLLASYQSYFLHSTPELHATSTQVNVPLEPHA